MRPKTKRRLIILSVVLFVVFGGTTLFVIIRQGHIAQAAKQWRIDGMAAYEAGNYDVALERLSKYASKDNNKNDADAVFALAVSRGMVSQPNNRHLKTAIDWLNRYRELRPDDIKAQRQLLDLYMRARWNTETLATAEDILRADPNDLQALRAKVGVLNAQRKYTEALPASEKINQTAPLDFEGQRMTYTLLMQLKRPAGEIMTRAKAGLDQHPEDPRFELLMAIAQNYAGDQDGAQKLLVTAANRKAPDVDFVRAVTRLLDSAKAFEFSQRVLERASVDLNDPAVLQLLVQRLWQTGKIDQMAEKLATVGAQDPKANTNLLAMKAISLFEAAKPAEAEQVVATLAQRTLDDEAFAWSTSLPAYYNKLSVDPRGAIESLQSAANRDRDNAVVKLWLGDAYQKLNEIELAVNAWRQAASMSPAWATPLTRQATALARAGRPEEAYAAAEIAAQRAPQALETRVAAAMALSARLSVDPDFITREEMLRAVSAIQKDSPNEPETLPMYVTLLTRTGQKDKAVAAIKAALAPDTKVPADTLLRIITVSRELKLDQEKEIFAALAQRGHDSPEVSLGQARDLHDAGKSQEGLAMLRERAGQSSGDEAGWNLSLAKYVDLAYPKESGGYWKTTVEKFPNDLRVQSAFLNSPARLSQREVWAATVERLKSITREEGVSWRVERAKYLLSGQPSDKDLADAVTLLSELIRQNPDVAEPRLLLASAMLRSNNNSGAIDQLKRAVELRPNDPQIALDLTRLLMDAGKPIDAQAYIEQMLKSGKLSLAGVRVIAQLLADQGDTEQAIELLRSTPAGDVGRDVLLAQMYRRKGLTREAGDLFAKLAAAKPITADAIAAISEFYFAAGDKDRANQALNRLNETEPTGATAELIRARLAERFDAYEAAEVHYKAAVAKTNDALVHRELAGFYLRASKADQARKAVAEGLKAVPNHVELTALAKVIDRVAALPVNANADSLINQLSRRPTYPPASDLLTAIIESQALNTSSRAAQLKLVADKYTRFWPAREQLVRAYLAADELNKAREHAQVAVTQFPADPEPTRLLCTVYNAMNQPSAALTIAQQWRQRSLDNPRAPDVAAAEAYLAMGQPRETINLLRPYIDSAKLNLLESMDVLWPYCRAMLREGKSPEITSLLADGAAKHAPLRLLCLAMAADVAPDAAAATAWINALLPKVSADSKEEQAALSYAWFVVGQRYNDLPSYGKAVAMMRDFAAKDPNNLSNLIMLAEGLRATNDLTGAEAAFRQAIAQGDSAYSPNALAFLLLMQNRSIDEALSLADRAIAAEPRNANYLDTRGQIHLRMGRHDLALQDFDRALSFQPNLVDSLVGKAEALAKAGRKDKANELLQHIDLVKKSQPISPYSQKQLDGVRASIQ